MWGSHDLNSSAAAPPVLPVPLWLGRPDKDSEGFVLFALSSPAPLANPFAPPPLSSKITKTQIRLSNQKSYRLSGAETKRTIFNLTSEVSL